MRQTCIPPSVLIRVRSAIKPSGKQKGMHMHSLKRLLIVYSVQGRQNRVHITETKTVRYEYTFLMTTAFSKVYIEGKTVDISTKGKHNDE
ncbi:hypothetical protein DPMN_013001 [Dreissena polymorpha]|uniref:Uncharacterized protein n=1 Tax=Dreissena polymorpha TaxID=45954 RepID=A0A9D4N6X7_DREPO|nr:hypothetical protein DPMN_013001 [Dreissena polymorpha]